MNTTILGDGTVGKALAKAMGITALGPSEEEVRSDVVIICVPTPTVDGVQDLSSVKQALGRVKEAKLVILRSTVLPGTTEQLQKGTDIPLMFVPEWGFEATMEEDLAHPGYHILGYTTKSVEFTQLAKDTLPYAIIYRIVTAKAAEYSKYFANIWGATQVALANSLYDWVGEDEVYEQAVSAARLHKNIPQWGWKIHDQGSRGYGGKCLPKEVQAAISQFPHPLWMEMERYNAGLK